MGHDVTRKTRVATLKLLTLNCLTSKILCNRKLRKSLIGINPKLTTKVLQMPARFNESENVP